MYLFFAFLGFSCFFCMAVWVVVCVGRLLRPEPPPPRIDETAYLHRVDPDLCREPAPVGVREIRQDQLRRQQRQVHVRYYYHPGLRRGVPGLWVESLWERRN